MVIQNSQKKFFHAVRETICKWNMLKIGDAVLMGISGGADSVALLRVLVAIAPEMRLCLGIAHLNHSLRGHESDRDEFFVKKLAEDFNLPYYSEKQNVFAYKKKHGLSLEEAARKLRYDFFYRIAANENFDKIALGHQADDNAELVLMNILRGSGLSGMAGIPPVRDEKIIRPLIRLSRNEILDFLEAEHIDYVQDSSNTDTKYQRNSIRHELLPLLEKKYNPNISSSLNRLSDIIQEEESWLNEFILQLFEDIADIENNTRISLNIIKIKTHPKALQRRIFRRAIESLKGNLRRITLFHIDEIFRLAQKNEGSARLNLPDGICVLREYNQLIFIKNNSLHPKADRAEFKYTIDNIGAIFIPELNMTLKLSLCDKKSLCCFNETGHNVAFFDMNKISFPMILRNHKPGDRFSPFGIEGTQKLKKYFINQKIPAGERHKYPVLVSSGKIIWLLGQRIDNSVQLTDATKMVLKAEIVFFF